MTVSSDQARELRLLGASTVLAASEGAAAWVKGLRSFSPRARAAGPARTVCIAQGDNLGVHEAVARLRAWEVLVVGGGDAEVALFGEILAAAAIQRDASAIVVDGAIRDLESLRALGLPVFARSVSPASPERRVPGDHQVELDLGGTRVSPGDWVIADEDAVVVLAAGSVDDVLRGAVRRREQERQALDLIKAGVGTLEALTDFGAASGC